MKYLSICSGIEAASVAEKRCGKCSAVKALDSYHRQPSGKHGRLHRRVHGLKLGSLGIDERLDAPNYFRRSHMQHLS